MVAVLVTVPDVPDEASQRWVPAVIGLLTDQAVVASSQTVCGEVVRVRVNPVFPDWVPDRTTLVYGVECQRCCSLPSPCTGDSITGQQQGSR